MGESALDDEGMGGRGGGGGRIGWGGGNESIDGKKEGIGRRMEKEDGTLGEN